MVAFVAAVVLAGGCEDATHENIDKWMRTEKGPGKLRDAVKNRELSPALRAHAAVNIIRMDERVRALELLENMPEAAREPVVAEMVTRLWELARVTGGKNAMPGPGQVSAKDALFALRPLASTETQNQIDEYLVEWLTRGYYYKDLAEMGRYSGALAMRAAGERAADALIQSVNSLLGARDSEGNEYRVDDDFLLGLAVTGDPEAVGVVLDLIEADRDDETLPERAMAALYQAYVEPDNPSLEPADPAALVAHQERIARLLKDEGQPIAVINGALELIGATDKEHCLEPLVSMVSYPHSNEDFRWVGVDNALHCGGVDAIVPVAEALPPTDRYEADVLRTAVWQQMIEAGEPGAVAEKARALLDSDSWVARITGIELLGMLELADQSRADVERLEGLAGDDTILKGWWGDQSDRPRGQRKTPPTVAQRAGQVAAKLRELATGAQKQ